MRTAREGNAVYRVAVNYGIFKLPLIILLISQAVCVTTFPQRGNVHFPSSNYQQDQYPSYPSDSGGSGGHSNPGGIVPILIPHNTNNDNNNNNNQHQPQNDGFNNGGFYNPSEFEMGSTGISCDRPGTFQMAPDGCNRCFCAQNQQLSAACSRVFCPPGFPSSSRG